VCSADILTIRERWGEVAPGFLQHLLYDRGFWDFIVANSTGSITRRIKWRQIAKYEFALPPIDEQQRIVELLSAVDAHVSCLAKQAEAALTARSAVLSESLSAGGDDWAETTLGDVAEWHSGGTPKAGEPEFYAGGTIPWAVIADMADGEIRQTEKLITPAGLEKIGGRLAPVGSTLISMYATVGRAAFAHLAVATNQAIAWSVPDEGKINPRFLFLVAQSLENVIASSARGATQRNISRTMLREFGFLLPPMTTQERIVEIVSSIDDLIQATEHAVAET
jgi:type I restriction enzyme S subunit